MVAGPPLPSPGGGGGGGGGVGSGGEEEEMGGRGNAVDYLCVNDRRCGRRPLV